MLSFSFIFLLCCGSIVHAALARDGVSFRGANGNSDLKGLERYGNDVDALQANTVERNNHHHRALAGLGEVCSSPSQCTGPGEQTCSSGKCVCNTGYYASDATTCTIAPAGYFPSAMSG
jgi:hypothetical protein